MTVSSEASLCLCVRTCTVYSMCVCYRETAPPSGQVHSFGVSAFKWTMEILAFNYLGSQSDNSRPLCVLTTSLQSRCSQCCNTLQQNQYELITASIWRDVLKIMKYTHASYCLLSVPITQCIVCSAKVMGFIFDQMYCLNAWLYSKSLWINMFAKCTLYMQIS